MSISTTYTVGTPTYSITSGGQAQAILVLTYAMSGDGSSTSFVQPVGGFGLGTPASVAATITKQQVTGTPPYWLKNNVYALNTIVQANGFLQKVTTAGTSMPGWAANTTYATNQTICDPYGNMQTCTVGGTSGTSLPTNFAANMAVNALTVDNGVTWQCTANICPNFSNVTNATTTDNTGVWTCQGANSVVPTYDAPNVTPTLSGTNLTLTFNEALKAPGATNTDAYGTVFTYTAWVVTVTLTYSTVVSNPIQSQSTTWTSSTAVNTTSVINCSGASTVTVTATTSGTLTAGAANYYVSIDNVNWFSINASTPYSFGIISGWGFNSGPLMYQFQVGGYNYFRVQLTTALVGSGSATWLMQTSNLFIGGLITVGQPFGNSNHMTLDDASSGATANLSVKGTQGTNALTTQDIHDAGRNSLTFYFDQLTGVTTEALGSMNSTKGFVAQTAGTTYTVTAGKTLRLQSLVITVRDTTTTLSTSRVRVRVNTSGTVVASSPIAYAVEVVNLPGTAAAGVGTAEAVDFPDGLEIPGGSQIGMSHIESSVSCTISVCLLGYEY
jgi:hypothetical protein